MEQFKELMNPVSVYDAIGAPVSGRDTAADEWLAAEFDKGNMNGVYNSYEEAREKRKNEAVLKLIPPGNHDWDSLASTLGTGPFSFRCDVLIDGGMIDPDIIHPYIKNLLPTEMIMVAGKIEAAVQEVIAAEDYPEAEVILNMISEQREAEFKGDEEELAYCISAYKWLNFWGNRGFFAWLSY